MEIKESKHASQSAFNFFLFIVGCLTFFVLFFIPFIAVEQRLPGSTIYGFPSTPFGDYYHYTYFLKSGIEGRLNFENVYTDQVQPIQFLEPHYNLVGLLSRPLRLTNVQLFYLLRVFTIPIVIFSVIQVIYRLFTSRLEKILALIFMLFVNSFWWFGVPEPEVWSNIFNVFRRSVTLPPHYWISICLYIALFIHLIHPRKTIRHYVITAFISFNITVMHPYVAFYLWVMIVVEFLLRSIVTKKFNLILFSHVILYAATMCPVLLYYRYALSHFWFSPVLSGGTTIAVPRTIPILNYLLSVGPLTFIALLSLFIPSTYKDGVKRYLLVWLIIPFGLFFLPDVKIPMSPFRLFQTFQPIPAALLAVSVIAFFVHRFPVIVRRGIYIFFGVLCVAYAVPAYLSEYGFYTQLWQPYFRHYNAIQEMQPVLSYLNSYAPRYSVVVAPDMISSMIPSFTHSNVLIGQEGCNPTYYENKPMIDAFYDGTLPLEKLKYFFQKKRVSYVLFGVEAETFEASPYKTSPLLKEVFRNDRASIVKVLF